MLGCLSLEQEKGYEDESDALRKNLIKNKDKVNHRKIVAHAEKIVLSSLNISETINILLEIEIFAKCTNLRSCKECGKYMDYFVKRNSSKNWHELIGKLVRREEIEVCETMRLRLSIEYARIFYRMTMHKSPYYWFSLEYSKLGCV